MLSRFFLSKFRCLPLHLPLGCCCLSSSTRLPPSSPITLSVPAHQAYEAKELGAKKDRVTGAWSVSREIFDKEGSSSFGKWLSAPLPPPPPSPPSPPPLTTTKTRPLPTPSAEKTGKGLTENKDRTIVFFDIETNGLPVKHPKFGSVWDFRDLAKYDSSRIVQMSLLSCTRSTLDVIETYDLVIKADNFSIPNHAFHGITIERSMSEGLPFQEAATLAHAIFGRADAIIAHNAAFDLNVYKSELCRYGLTDCLAAVERKAVICSMLETREIVKAPSKNGWTKTKPPSLLELYRFSTGKQEMANAHNSLYDVINLHEAVKALVLKNQLSLELVLTPTKASKHRHMEK